MEALEKLGNNVDLLLKKHAALQDENKRLRATIDGQNITIDSLSKKLKSLEHGDATMQIGLGMADKENARKQLDAMIAEIDKILLALND